MKRYILNGAAMTSREEAHWEIAHVLQFPDWYGANLDALWDLIEDVDGEIVLEHTDLMLSHLGDYGVKLLQILRSAGRPANE